MIPFGKCTLTLKHGDVKTPVAAEFGWVSSSRDWRFVDEWRLASQSTGDQKKIDSTEFATISEGRWRYLNNRRECALSPDDACQRSGSHPEKEFGFGIVIFMQDSNSRRIVGFIYVRWLWSRNLCLDYLGTLPPPDIKNVGVPLLSALAKTALLLGAQEVWGECTADSQTFYQRVKRDLVTTLYNSNEAQSRLVGWQSPDAIRDRFSFDCAELKLLSVALDARQKDVDQRTAKG